MQIINDEKGAGIRMKKEHAGLIEPIELKERFFLHYGVRHPEYYYFHAHQGMELLLIHQGQGQIVIGDKLEHVGSGSLMLFQPYQLHRIHMSAGFSYERSVLLFDPSTLDAKLESFPALQRFFRMLWRSELPAQHYSLGELEREAKLALMHGDQAIQAAVADRRLEEMTLTAISLLQLIRRVFPADASDMDYFSQIPRTMGYTEKAIQWIEAHFTEEFQLARLAEELYVSPSHVSRLFHQETGATLTEFITARRLREACLLLAATKLSVREISLRVGLTNVPYFGKLFRRNLGMTPLQYRNSRSSGE